MALTLVEASKLSNDTLVAGVIETMAQESPVLQRLPFIEITGNGLTYNRENTPPSADFYSVGDTNCAVRYPDVQRVRLGVELHAHFHVLSLRTFPSGDRTRAVKCEICRLIAS